MAKKSSFRAVDDQLNSERPLIEGDFVKTSLVPIEAILNANTSRGKVDIGKKI